MSEQRAEYDPNTETLAELQMGAVPQPMTDGSQWLLAKIIKEPGAEYVNMAQPDAEAFFEKVVFPSIGEQRRERNETLKNKSRAATLEGTTERRIQELRWYVAGLSLEEIGIKTGNAPRTARTNMARTMREFLSTGPRPDYFKAKLVELIPDVSIEQPLPRPPVKRLRRSQPVARTAVEATTTIDTEIQPTESPKREPRFYRASGSGKRPTEAKDSFGMYLDEIAKNPLLDAEKEVELSKTIEAGLMARALLESGRFGKNAPGRATKEELEWLAEEGTRAVDQFTTANLRLVVSIARKYGRAQMPMLDLVQEGNTGLIRAVEKFDYTKGYKFSTYATWWVRQAITRGIAQQARVVRLPVHVVEELNQVGSARRTLARDLGRDPEPEEIAFELGMDTERVNDLMTWGRDHVSLDTPVDEDGDTTLGDLMAHDTSPGPDMTVLDIETRERLEALIDTLKKRDADILRDRYGLSDGRQHKLADIGAKHGLSAERVRQIEREALQKLRRIGDPDLGA